MYLYICGFCCYFCIWVLFGLAGILLLSRFFGVLGVGEGVVRGRGRGCTGFRIRIWTFFIVFRVVHRVGVLLFLFLFSFVLIVFSVLFGLGFL